MLNYNIGDKVMITDNLHDHNFEIGEIVTITKLFPDDGEPHYRAETEDGYGWYITEEEFEALK